MSASYRPTSNATAGSPWDVAFLSERDVSSQVPINFSPHAGIYLTPACFGNGVYDDTAARLCISNLIASQLRRFVIDIYWDSTARVFSLCPVKVPNVSPVVAGQLATTSGTPTSALLQDLTARQTAVVNNVTQTTFTTVIRPTPTGSSARPATTMSASGTVLYQLGQYQCSSTLDIDTVLDVFQSYYEQSANTIDARLQYLIFNLRAAEAVNTTGTPSGILSQGQLPGRNENFGGHFEVLDKYTYTPSQLYEERQNLNGSWFRTSDSGVLPLTQYFVTQLLPNGDLSTPDGWPNEIYVQFAHSRRVLLAYGSVGSDMTGYNIGQDTDFFPPGTLNTDISVQINSTGGITSGCFYNGSAFDVRQINSSWATSGLIATDLQVLGNAADNFTTCGISPVLNATLFGTAADVMPKPYQDFGNQALFSWGADEPKNDTAFGSGLDNAEHRCAVAVSNNDYRGDWRVADCREQHYVACREANQPYRWRISSDRASFFNAATACNGNASFDVPRTGLENSYLYHRILLEASQRNQLSMIDATWIDFNSLDIENCWITTGVNGTCPYRDNEDAIRQRQILVPSIAAFIVLLLTLLTMLVKCNANRRNSRLRKRGEGGWDYEGVPS